MALFWFGSIFCLLAPDTWLQVVGLANFVRQYRDPAIGIVFGVTTLWFFYDLLTQIYAWIMKSMNAYRKKKHEQKTQKNLIDYLNRLTTIERNIISRFPRDGRNLVALRLEGEDVFDLIEKTIICQVEGMEEQTETGPYHYFKLNELIKPYVYTHFAQQSFPDTTKKAQTPSKTVETP